MYTVKAPVGMHARHAGLLVQEAKKYASTVTMSLGERTADAKRILPPLLASAAPAALVMLPAVLEGLPQSQSLLTQPLPVMM